MSMSRRSLASLLVAVCVASGIACGDDSKGVPEDAASDGKQGSDAANDQGSGGTGGAAGDAGGTGGGGGAMPDGAGGEATGGSGGTSGAGEICCDETCAMSCAVGAKVCCTLAIFSDCEDQAVCSMVTGATSYACDDSNDCSAGVCCFRAAEKRAFCSSSGCGAPVCGPGVTAAQLCTDSGLCPTGQDCCDFAVDGIGVRYCLGKTCQEYWRSLGSPLACD